MLRPVARLCMSVSLRYIDYHMQAGHEPSLLQSQLAVAPEKIRGLVDVILTLKV